MFDKKYGYIDVPGAPKDEPCIVLRAQDAFAVAALKAYYMAASGACEQTHLNLIQETVSRFIAWPIKKIPDTFRKQLKTPD